MRSTIIWLLPSIIGCAAPEAGTEVETYSSVSMFEFRYDQDADLDNISDLDEGGFDSDQDGVEDYLDFDSDGDGISDFFEAGDDSIFTVPVDSDSDGIPDYLDLDSDENCLLDSEEANLLDGRPWNSDVRGEADYADWDNDGDGISDEIELGVDCEQPDSDGDTVPDYLDVDSDDDGIEDRYETDYDSNRDGIPNYLDLDSDGDGLTDFVEAGQNPSCFGPADTDEDCVGDYRDSDSDNDGVDDYDEVFVFGTSHLIKDTDGDDRSDMAELMTGYDPLDASEYPEDVVTLAYLEHLELVIAVDQIINLHKVKVEVVEDYYGFVDEAVVGMDYSDGPAGRLLLKLNLLGVMKESYQDVGHPIVLQVEQAGELLKSVDLVVIVPTASPGTICIPM